MIDRTTFDLRLADHAATTARINAGDWRRQGAPQRQALRPVLAAALVALAARLAPAGVRRPTATA
jgi:hypothetical protein